MKVERKKPRAEDIIQARIIVSKTIGKVHPIKFRYANSPMRTARDGATKVSSPRLKPTRYQT
jgi:hypothetical protein